MSTLILTLPFGTGGAASAYDYVLTPDGQQIGSHGQAALDLLPAQAGRGAELVALIPARALSWHSIAVPEKVLRSLLSGRLEPARARGVLAGLLEEQLLDDPDQLHFAVFAGAPAGPDQTPTAWVAVCDRAWLQAGLQALESAGRPVARIVAECTPTALGSAQALLSAELAPAQMLLCTPQGVTLLPLLPASIGLAQAQPGLEVRAEPAVMELAQKNFGHAVLLQTRAQHLLLAAQSPWNLAQLELSASPGGRFLKRLSAGWQQLLQGSQWRPLRWGLVALLLVQLVAVNALAWRQRSLLEAKRASVQTVLQQTFPEVQLVIDAPLQMQRAVDDLARSRGAGTDADLGRVFSIINPLVPPGMVLSAIELSGKQLQLTASGVTPDAAQRITDALQSRGLRARWQDGQFFITPKESN